MQVLLTVPNITRRQDIISLALVRLVSVSVPAGIPLVHGQDDPTHHLFFIKNHLDMYKGRRIEIHHHGDPRRHPVFLARATAKRMPVSRE